ncbi:CHAT domain-containing protein [filamentous cyanobacterium LEGE 11480]|uniref:CHAT domain-containing protein n=1 Tax=Romeriopsis navalis LEGE 11480 TaxID=2777977 RepID=A0A928VJW3_9CYAN|nr:CHAT domain-containing protein [Romeriopsis navalis]MBE9029931.1 CHAT domain-containing protein [Romeriopsis navalis LEGE 11480]
MAKWPQACTIILGFGLMGSPLLPSQTSIVQAQTATQSSTALIDAASRLVDQKQYKRAITLYQQALTQLKSSQDVAVKRRALYLLGTTYRYDQQHQLAHAYLKQALTLDQQQKKPLLEGITLRAIGLNYRDQKQYDPALDYLKQAQVVLSQQPQRYWQMNSWYDLGNLYQRRKEYQQAITAYTTGLSIAQALQRINSIGMLHYRLAQSHNMLKANQVAAKHYKASIPLLRQTKYDVALINAHIQLGKVSRRLGQPKAAIAHVTTGLELAKKHKRQSQVLQALYNLGWLYNGMGLPTQSQPYLEQALALAREYQDEYYEQITLGELGLMALARGRYATAIDFLEQSLKLARRMKNWHGVQSNISNLGIAYYSLGDYNQAAGYYFQALKYAKATRNRSLEGKVNGSLGILYRVVKRYQAAETYSKTSLAIAQALGDLREQKTTYLDLGLLYSQQEKIDAAIDAYLKALDLAKRTDDAVVEGKLYGNLGLIYERQGEYQQAAEYMRASVAIAATRGDLRERGVGLSNLGTILIGLKQYDEAAKHLRASIAIWDHQRAELNRNRQYNKADRQKINLFERQAISYRHLQRALVAQSAVEPALEIAEQARTRALVELMARKQDGSTVNLGEQNNINITELKRIAREQNATIVEYSLLSGWVSPPAGQGTQRRLRDTTLLTWVIQPSGKVDLRQVDLRSIAAKYQTPLASLIRQSRQAIGVRSRGQRKADKRDQLPQPTSDRPRALDINLVNGSPLSLDKAPNRSAQALYQVLIAPIQDLLPQDQSQHVVFIPQDFLFSVPFYALQDAQGRYLIDQYTIRSAPSIQVLGLTKADRLPVADRNQALFESALIVGNPTMPTITSGTVTEQLLPLPATEIEAKQVAQLTNSTALIGAAAKKSTVLARMPQAKLIHLATHGLLDDFQNLGIPGAIALAPDGTGQPNDGILTTDELTSETFKLQADLVVLSACDTGRGQIKGDGVIGLSRSFLAAGVPSLVVSLWAVDDASTAVLMTEFYRQLKMNPDRAVALRQAMLKTREKYPDPYYWAAFSLVGQR